MSIWSAVFWAATAERAIRTAAQAALGALGANVLTDVRGVNWVFVASVAGLAALVSILMAVATGAVQGSGPGFTEIPAIPKPNGKTPPV